MRLLLLSVLVSMMTAPVVALAVISCDTMQPDHEGTTPRTSEPPYTLSIGTASYTPNSQITGKLQVNYASRVPVDGKIINVFEICDKNLCQTHYTL